MNRVCLHVHEHLTVVKETGRPTVYGTIFECRLKLQSAEKRNEVCAANHEKTVTDLCPRVGAWSACPFFEPRPPEDAPPHA